METPATHLVHYMIVSHGRLSSYGEFDTTLPAGWTLANKEWCKAEILKNSPQAYEVTITGVTEYKPALPLDALRTALVDLAANLDKSSASISAVRQTAAALRVIAAEVSK